MEGTFCDEGQETACTSVLWLSGVLRQKILVRRPTITAKPVPPERKARVADSIDKGDTVHFFHSGQTP